MSTTTAQWDEQLQEYVIRDDQGREYFGASPHDAYAAYVEAMRVRIEHRAKQPYQDARMSRAYGEV